MRAALAIWFVACSVAAAQPVFAAASVKPSARLAGPDANNRFAFEPAGISARNTTLRYLIAEAYGLQLRQVLGPAWLDRDEYDVEAKADGAAPKEQLASMLRALLTERFALAQHHEARTLRAFALVVDKGGPKMRPAAAGEPPVESGPRFHGELRRFADLLAVKLSIAMPDDPTQPGRASGTPPPVLDRTNLPGIYDFAIDVRPDGSDMLTLWQRFLKEKLGLRLDSRNAAVDVLVVDDAKRVPSEN
jgi:uncharacterized protein (TIGR03435 family)